MKFTCFIIFSFFIMNVFSIQTLKKYGSLKANENFVMFESDSFSVGDKMFFKIETEEYCDDYLYYQYYNDYDDLPSLLLFTPLYYVRQTSHSSVRVNGRITSMTRYFTIEKKKSELDLSNGKYLLLNYKCTSQYEIENTESNGSTTIIIIVVIVFCVIIVIFIIVIVVFCYRRKARLMMMNRQMPYNYVVPYGGSPYYQQPVYPYPQMPNNQVVYQNPQPIYMSPSNVPGSNVQIMQNGEIPNAQSPSSQRNITPQTFEKPHIQQ